MDEDVLTEKKFLMAPVMITRNLLVSSDPVTHQSRSMSSMKNSQILKKTPKF